jgi:hypothetical protein
MASDTARPPPGAPQPSDHPSSGESRFVIQLFYPNNIAIAQAVAAHIKKRSEDTLEMPVEKQATSSTTRRAKAYAGLKPAITEYEKLPDNIRGVIAHVLVVGIDESCEPRDLAAEIRRYFCEDFAVVIHVTTDAWIDTLAYLVLRPIGMFNGYEFSKLDDLLEKAAQDLRPTRKFPKPLP